MGVAADELNGVGSEMQILLIEPNDETRGLLELALSARGHAVTTGSGAHDALCALDHQRFPMIVVNRELPDSDGLRFCRQLRETPNAINSTIIVISDQCEATDRADALEAGANDCLAWPADAVTLRVHLEAVERSHAEEPPAVEPAQAEFPTNDGEAMMVLDRDGTIRNARGSLSSWLYRRPGDLIGVSAFALFHLDDAPELLSLSAQAMSVEGPTAPVVVRLRGGDGAWHRLRMRAVNRLADPDVRGIVLFAVPEAGEGDGLPDRDGLYDPVTHAPTFPLFMDRLDHAMERARRRNEHIAAIVVDLDGMRGLDDRVGAGALNDLACQIADRIQGCLRAGDTVGRVRPDEFAAVVEDIDLAGEAVAIAERLVEELGAAFVIDGVEHAFTPRVGVCLCWGAAAVADDVMREARNAHQAATQEPAEGGRYVLYELGVPAPHVEPILALEPPIEPVAPSNGVSLRGDETEFWFSPLMDRISNLELEIDRLRERRDGASMAVAS